MCVSLVSALTKKPILNNLAMTGEITLQGRVLSIGGLKEKLLAAKQHGIKTVILPEENRDDAQEILQETSLSSITLIFVKNMDEVLNSAFEKNVFSKRRKTSRPRARKSLRKK